jgi:hypothetical protein
LIFSSCANTDDNETELSVIGGWTVDESILNGEVVTNQSVIRLLSADNRTEFRYLDDIEGNLELRIEQGDWTMNENVLTIDFDNPDFEPKVYTITNLQSSSMKWESEIFGEGILKETLTK